jgi:hypothetical protein
VKITMLSFALASGLALSNVVLAESFNNRSPDVMISASSPSQQIQVATVQGFNDRSVDFRNLALVGSKTPKQEGLMALTGFTNRSDWVL